MKYLILLFTINVSSCFEAKAQQKQDIGQLLNCEWSNILEECFCYRNIHEADPTWVPEKVCIKFKNKGR